MSRGGRAGGKWPLRRAGEERWGVVRFSGGRWSGRRAAMGPVGKAAPVKRRGAGGELCGALIGGEEQWGSSLPTVKGWPHLF